MSIGYDAGAAKPGGKDLRSLVSGVIRDMVGGIFEAYAASQDPGEGATPLDEEAFVVALLKKSPEPKGTLLCLVQGIPWEQDKLLYIELSSPTRDLSPREMKAVGLNPPGSGAVPNEHNLWRTFEMEARTASEVSDELVSLLEMLHDPFGLDPSEVKLEVMSQGGELYADTDRRVASDPRHSGILIEVAADVSRRRRRRLLLRGAGAVACVALAAFLL